MSTGNDGVLVESPPLTLVVILKSFCFFIGITGRVREGRPEGLRLILPTPQAIAVGGNIK